jgi:hypothetical protein
MVATKGDVSYLLCSLHVVDPDHIGKRDNHFLFLGLYAILDNMGFEVKTIAPVVFWCSEIIGPILEWRSNLSGWSIFWVPGKVDEARADTFGGKLQRIPCHYI